MIERRIPLPDFMRDFHYIQYGNVRIENAGYTGDGELLDAETAALVTECVKAAGEQVQGYGDFGTFWNSLLSYAAGFQGGVSDSFKGMLKSIAYITWLFYHPDTTEGGL